MATAMDKEAGLLGLEGKSHGNMDDLEGHSTVNHNNQQIQNAEDDSPFGQAPEGGVQAWLCAAGGAALFFCCLGFANSFGSFEEYYLSHQLRDHSPDSIAWTGSLSSFLQFASCMLGGPLFDRYGAWVSGCPPQITGLGF